MKMNMWNFGTYNLYNLYNFEIVEHYTYRDKILTNKN